MTSASQSPFHASIHIISNNAHATRDDALKGRVKKSRLGVNFLPPDNSALQFPHLPNRICIPTFVGLMWVSMHRMKVKGAHSCLTLCDPMDYTVHGILQARILEWVAFPFSKGSSQQPQGSNPGLLHCKQILYPLSHQGGPRIVWGSDIGQEAIQVAQWVKNLPAMQELEENADSIPGSGGSLREANSNPLQYSCLENPHGQRSLAGYSSWGHKVGHDWSDWAHTHIR